MVKASKGIRKGTRNKFRKSPRERGVPPVTQQLKSFEIGEKANIVINSSIHKGQPHVRFHGLTGTVIGKQGDAYVLDVKAGNKHKKIISNRVHLHKNV